MDGRGLGTPGPSAPPQVELGGQAGLGVRSAGHGGVAPHCSGFGGLIQGPWGILLVVGPDVARVGSPSPLPHPRGLRATDVSQRAS